MNLMGKPPLGLKEPKPPKPARKRMRQVSEKRAAYRASAEGKRALEWMALVKGLPCVVCGKPGPSDAHHVCHDRFGTAKASDFDVIPLCRGHHTEGPEAIHNGKTTWREKHGPDYGYLPLVSAQLSGPTEIDF